MQIQITGCMFENMGRNMNTKSKVIAVSYTHLLNPDIVTAIGLMLLFSSLGFRKGYFTMLLAHISFCTPYVITSVYPKVRSLDPVSYTHLFSNTLQKGGDKCLTHFLN